MTKTTDQHSFIITTKDGRVGLTQITKEMISMLNTNANNSWYWLDRTYFSLHSTEGFIEDIRQNDHEVHLAVVSREKLVGVVGAILDQINRIATLGMVFSQEVCSQGIGTQAAALFADVLTLRFNIRKFESSALSDNARSIGLQQKLGLVEEGRRLRKFQRGDRYLDEILMGGFTADWLELRKGLDFLPDPHPEIAPKE